MLSVSYKRPMVRVITLNVIMLSVVAPTSFLILDVITGLQGCVLFNILSQCSSLGYEVCLSMGVISWRITFEKNQ
jgi:hypothetical protein